MALSAQVVKEFCGLCNEAFKFNKMHRILFDDNPSVEKLNKSNNSHFYSRLSVLTHEYSLLQLIKLHDPAVQNGRINLTLEYVVVYGAWDKGTRNQLNDIYKILEELARLIKPARNKVLSHNDLASILDGLPLGGFPKDKDKEYFCALQKFADIVHNETIGGPYPFDDVAAIKDSEIFLETILRGDKSLHYDEPK